jgi:hypothetical protein
VPRAPAGAPASLSGPPAFGEFGLHRRSLLGALLALGVDTRGLGGRRAIVKTVVGQVPADDGAYESDGFVRVCGKPVPTRALPVGQQLVDVVTGPPVSCQRRKGGCPAAR